MSETTELVAQQILNGNINKRTWGDILYNVKVYGAIGDGVTDDTVAIQSAINYAISVGGTVIFFPHGTYKVTYLSNLSSVNLIGDNSKFIGISDLITQFGEVTLSFLSRQAIINGNFDVWQRGTTFNSAVNGTYTSDRFKIGTNLGDNNVRVLRSTVVPNGMSKFSCRLEGFGGIGGAGASTTFAQEIEDFSFFAGKQVTFSGYVKCDAGVAVAPLIFDGVNTVTGTTILSTSWTRFSLTFTLVSDPTSLRVFLLLNRSSLGVGAGINFTQLQLNIGSSPLPFQPKSFADELQQCLRYYEKSYNYSDEPGTASFNGATAYPSYQANGTNRLGVLYKVAKRIAGTVTIYNPATGASGQMTNSGSPITAAATDIGNGGFATFPGGTYVANNDIRFHYVCDAEI